MAVENIQLEDLQQIVGEQCVRTEEPMAQHTTFKIGGPAAFYVEVNDEEELESVIQLCSQKQVPYFILGNGSNLLVSDDGYPGVMISTKRFDYIIFEGRDPKTGKERVSIGSGVMLAKAAVRIAGEGMKGFEFAGGIPGTIGGAVAMNAGAYGGEIADVLTAVRVMKEDGSICEMTAKELELSYRHSILQEQELVVLEAFFAFEEDKAAKIQEKMRQFGSRRREKQPLEYGSAGSTFKRPEGRFAGKLIEDAGLKGYRIGDIMVSEKHAGFIVNVGKGTCKDAMKVIEHVQHVVQEQFKVALELEVKCIG